MERNICTVIVGADDRVGIIVRSCWMADWRRLIEATWHTHIWQVGGKRVGGVADVVEADVFTVVLMVLDPSEEVVGALDAVASGGWIRVIRSALVLVAKTPKQEQ